MKGKFGHQKGQEFFWEKIKARLDKPLNNDLHICYIDYEVKFGVFTSAPIKAGTVIGVYAGLVEKKEDLSDNGDYAMDFRDERGIIYFMACRDIEKNEQLGISYGEEYWFNKKMIPKYFDKNGMVIPNSFYETASVSLSNTSSLFPKEDIIRRLGKITPSLCAAGFSWKYKEGTKEAWILVDDKNTEEIKAIFAHFKTNNIDECLGNLQLGGTKTGKVMLTFKLLKNDILGKIPIFHNSTTLITTTTISNSTNNFSSVI